MGHDVGIQPDTDSIAPCTVHRYLAHALHALELIHHLHLGIVGQVHGAVAAIRGGEGIDDEGQTGLLADGHTGVEHLGRYLRLGLPIAHVGEHLIQVGVGIRVEDHLQGIYAVVRRNGGHVIHALHTGNFAFQRSTHGVGHGLGIGTGEHGHQLDSARGNLRILGNREIHEAHQAQQRGHHGNHRGNHRMFNEKGTHGGCYSASLSEVTDSTVVVGCS